MPPTTVVAYQKRYYRDDISISTNSIQKCQPTSYCDDIADQFYITCLQPLVDLLPQAMEDRERILAEKALERGRAAVMDGTDLNAVGIWEKQMMKKRSMEKKLREKRLQEDQMQRRAKSNDDVADASGVDEDSACSSSSDSFVIREKPKNKKVAVGILRRVQPARLKPMPGKTGDSGSFIIGNKPKKGVAAAAAATTTNPKLHVTNESNTALASKSEVASNRESRLAIPSLKPSSAIKKVMLLTAHQHLALNKTLQSISTMKKVVKAPSKLSVTKKGFQVKPKLFRRKKKGGGDSDADDITLSSSNPPSESSCGSRELVVTEVSARKFGAFDELQSEEIRPLSLTTDLERASIEQDCASPGMDSVTDKSSSTASVPCTMIEKGSKPIVAAARKTYNPANVMKKSPSTRFSVDESPRRTTYDEREVDKYVSRLVAPPVKQRSDKEEDPDDADCPVSLDMQALMHSISQKYSVPRRDVNRNCKNEVDDDSELTDEKKTAVEFLPGKTVNETQLAPTYGSSAHESEASLPSVISVTRRAARSNSESLLSTNVTTSSSKSGSNDFAQVVSNPSNDSRVHDSTEQTLSASHSSRDSVTANKLNRLRMVRSAYAKPSVNTSNNSTNGHLDRQTHAQIPVQSKPCFKEHIQHRRVTWSENLTSISMYAVEQDLVEESGQLLNCNDSAARHENIHIAKLRSLGSTKSCLSPDRRVADSGKLNRMRISRNTIRVNTISTFGTDRPDDESLVCTRKKVIDHRDMRRELESSETTNDERNQRHHDHDIKPIESVESKRRQINRRARQLHQQRLQNMYSRSELTPFTAKCAPQNVTSTRENTMDYIQLRSTVEVQTKSRNSLLEDARRVRSFETKTLAARS